MTLESIGSDALIGIPIVIFIVVNAVAILIVDPKLKTRKARIIGRTLIQILSFPVTYILYMIILLVITSYKPV